MGRRGPPPKPTAIRKLEGNREHRPMPENEPEPEQLASLPEPPDHLCERAQQIFSDTAAVLQSYDLLTVADVHPIEMFADCYAQWIEAVELRQSLRAEGEDGSGAAKLCRELSTDCNRWFRVLGLGPAYRVGLVTNFGLGGSKADIADPVALRICGG